MVIRCVCTHRGRCEGDKGACIHTGRCEGDNVSMYSHRKV